MATPSIKLIKALRDAANKMEVSKDYQWGHMGSCNCGFLAQTITKLSKAEIHDFAMRKMGDWSEQAADYCSTSLMPFDLLLSELIHAGLAIEDLIHLERLSDKEVLESLPFDKKFLQHNLKDDVVLYILTWADVLESKITEKKVKEVQISNEIIFI